MAIAGPTTNHHEIRYWANSRHAVPVEVLPARLDSIPAVLRFMLAKQVAGNPQILQLSWEDFFTKFDLLGLAFVYDNDETKNYNEILQQEGHSPYRRHEYTPVKVAN